MRNCGRQHRWLLVLAVAGWFSMAAPLRAAPVQLPPVPLPPIPAPAVPVLELIAPVASPQCGNAIFASILLRTEFAAVPGGLPLEVGPILGPMFLICGTIGVPPARLSCSPDATAKGILDQITASVAGLPTPADTRVAGPAVEELILLQDALPPPANTAGLAASVSGALDCRSLSAVSAPPPPVDAPAPAPEPAGNDEAATAVFGDLFTGVTPTVDDAASASSPSPAAPIVRSPGVRTAATIRTGGFAYPWIFVLPLIALAIGGYLARSLTRPVTAR